MDCVRACVYDFAVEPGSQCVRLGTLVHSLPESLIVCAPGIARATPLSPLSAPRDSDMQIIVIIRHPGVGLLTMARQTPAAR